MTHPTDEELEAMASRLDVDDPWCQPLCYEAAAMLRACKAGDDALEPAPGYLDGWNESREAAAEKAEAEQAKAQENLDQLHSEGFGPRSALDIWTGRLVAAQELRAAIRALTPQKGPKHD